MTTEKDPQPKPVAGPKRTPLENYLDGFPMELAKRAVTASYGELFMGGDVSAYLNLRLAEYMRTAVLPMRQPVMPLGKRPMPKVGLIEVETEHFGRLTLDAFLARSDSYAQGYLVVHKGDIVYEQYPRMRREDHHLWMSAAKPTASLIIDMLISEGKIDENEPITTYLTDFQGTDWDGITTKDVMDMATGMDVEEPAKAGSIQRMWRAGSMKPSSICRMPLQARSNGWSTCSRAPKHSRSRVLHSNTHQG